MSFLSMSTPAPQQNLFGFIDAGRQIRRTPVVGMEFLHQRAMRPHHVVTRRSFPKAEDLVRLFLGQARPTPAATVAPRVTVRVTCLTPAGKPAVQIRF